MRFENPPKDDNKKVTALSKFTKAVTLSLGVALASLPDKAKAQDVKSIDSFKKDNTEININDQENIEKKEVNPSSYDLAKICILDLDDLEGKKSLDQSISKKVIKQALISDNIKLRELILSDSITGDYGYHKEENKKDLEILKKDKGKLAQKDWNYLSKNIKLSEKKKEYINEAPRLIALVEEIRNKIKATISTKEYLLDLMKEFNCTPEVALEHQRTRIKNLESINYKFTHSSLMAPGTMNAQGMYVSNSNLILLPYDLNFDESTKHNKLSIEDFKDAVFHEFSHAYTNGNGGLSLKAKKILQESFLKGNFNKRDSLYHNNPSERYARFKSLEAELDANSIKGFDELLTMDGYNKIVELYKENKFKDLGINQFLSHLKGFGTEEGYYILLKMFNNIATLDKFKTSNDYIHPDWNYENPTDIA